MRRDKVSILTSLLKFLNGEDGWRGVGACAIRRVVRVSAAQAPSRANPDRALTWHNAGAAKEEPTDGKFPLAKGAVLPRVAFRGDRARAHAPGHPCGPAAGVDFSALFAYHTSPMLVTEPHGRVVACNEAFCHTFDTTNEVVTRGAAALNILHAPSSEEFQSTLRSAAGAEGPRPLRR